MLTNHCKGPVLSSCMSLSAGSPGFYAMLSRMSSAYRLLQGRLLLGRRVHAARTVPYKLIANARIDLSVRCFGGTPAAVPITGCSAIGTENTQPTQPSLLLQPQVHDMAISEGLHDANTSEAQSSPSSFSAATSEACAPDPDAGSKPDETWHLPSGLRQTWAAFLGRLWDRGFFEEHSTQPRLVTHSAGLC